MVPPAGTVVPPIELKMVTEAAPLDVDDAVTLVVGVNIASIAQLLTERVSENGLRVEVDGPDALAYSKHRNLKPDEAVAVKVTVSPVV